MAEWHGYCKSCKASLSLPGFMDSPPKGIPCYRCQREVREWRYDPRTTEEKWEDLKKSSGICPTCGSMWSGKDLKPGVPCPSEGCGGILRELTWEDLGG